MTIRNDIHDLTPVFISLLAGISDQDGTLLEYPDQENAVHVVPYCHEYPFGYNGVGRT